MKKTNILMLILGIILFSCSESLYYSYNHGDTYCTLEVKKKQIIYRAVVGSQYHYINYRSWWEYRNNLEENKFIIELDAYPDYFVLKGFSKKNPSIPIYSAMLLWIDPDPRNKNRSILYSIGGINSDTITCYDKEFTLSILKDSVHTKPRIDWLPLEMYRTDKIDYKRLGRKLKDIDPKNPLKWLKKRNHANIALDHKISEDWEYAPHLFEFE